MKKFALSLLTAVLVAGSYVGVATSQSSSSQPAPGLMPRGTAATPGMYFPGDRDSGIYWPAADQFGITLSGGSAVIVDTAGLTFSRQAGADRRLVVANTSSNAAARSVLLARNGNAETDGAFLQALGTGFTTSGSSLQDGAELRSGSDLSGGLSIVAAHATSGIIRFYTSGTSTGEERARIANDGTFLIGTNTDSAFKLDVNGSIAHNGTQAYWKKGVTTFTSGSGTYTVPAGVRAINVRMAGGGGGGGYARAITTNGAKAAGGGGAAGCFTEFWLTGLSASYSYGVGAAGAAGIGSSSTASTNGGDTTFSTFTAKGGNRGLDVEVTTAVFTFNTMGAPGTPSANAGAHVNLCGDMGMPTWTANTAGNFYPGSGGSNPIAGTSGFGALVTADSGAAGNAGSGCGAGGSGAGAWRSTANQTATAGAGTAGCIIIEEYF